jgi:hypothetical protein
MKFNLVFSIFLFSSLSTIIYGQQLPGNIFFYPKISANGAYAEGSLKGFAHNTAYKTYALRADFPLTLPLADNIYADINYYARADYNNNVEGGADYTYKFSKANLNYKTDDFYLKLGRQAYAPQGKEAFIYYGEYHDKDNRLPSALEGVSGGAQTDLFSLSAVAAKEARRLSPVGDNSLIYGAQGAFKLGPLINIESFYYNRSTDSCGINEDISVYGGGFLFDLPEKFSLSFYAALNSGSATGKKKNLTFTNNYNGYALNGRMDITALSDFAKNNYRFNVFYGSAGESTSRPFTAIAANPQNGYVFGGMNLLNSNDFNALLNNLNPSKVSQEQALFIYSFDINVAPTDLKDIYFNVGIYNFISTAKEAAYKNIGSEADFKITYKKSAFEFNVIYGLFISGNGLAQATQSAAAANKTVNKIGIATSWEF